MARAHLRLAWAQVVLLLDIAARALPCPRCYPHGFAIPSMQLADCSLIECVYEQLVHLVARIWRRQLADLCPPLR